jgi:sulfatase modifying factor 1
MRIRYLCLPLIALSSCLALSMALAGPVEFNNGGMSFVLVGDAGNPADTRYALPGYGAVDREYGIGKTEVTIGQYVEFLNAKAKSDPYGLYATTMGTNQNIAGITRSGSSGNYSYSVLNYQGDSTNRPISYISWFDAARFANWMHNGKGSGSTETGAYSINGATTGTFLKNAGATFWIPTEDEWYKAAYYKGGSLNAGYWDYPTQSNTAPGNVIGSSANQANILVNGNFAVTGTSTYPTTQMLLTDVGAFSGSPSPYGTFDQLGSMMEWNDFSGGGLRGLRGQFWGSPAYTAEQRGALGPTSQGDAYGFRLATIAVPEPSTCAMVFAGVCSGGYSMWRRRKRA